MYGIHSYVPTKRGRYRVGYYRCRRASHKGTCAAKQIPAPVVERIVIDELRRLGLDPGRVAALAGKAQQAYAASLKPLIARRAQASAELERIAGRLGSLLELAEDRLVTKQEYAARRARLEAERAALESELAALEADIAARAATSIDAEATMRRLRRLGDVFDALDDVVDRRRLLATCLSRVVVRQGTLELHVPAVPLLVGSGEGANGPPKVPSFGKSAAVGRPENGAKNGQNGAEFPWLVASHSNVKGGTAGE
jgi:Recombinase zinc beta ribbon domain